MVKLEDIKDKCYIDDTSGCWIWKTAVLNNWTNRVRPHINWSENKKMHHAIVTRVVWELLHGKKFPEELQAGHICEDINDLSCFCVNPKHIIPVTQSENEFMKKIYSSDEEYDKYIEKAKKWGATTRTQNKMKKHWTIEERVMAIYNYESIKTPNPDFSTPCALMHNRSKKPDGYTYMEIRKDGNRKKILLHRAMCFINNKEKYKSKKEDARIVRHLCGNKICIEPTHLKFGDPSSNAYDSYMAGTHSNTVLKPDDVRHIFIDWIELNKNWNNVNNKGQPSKYGLVKAGWDACKYPITYTSFSTIVAGSRWGLIYEEFKEQLKEFK